MLETYVITVHPSIVAAYAKFGVLRAAADKGLGSVAAIDLRDFAVDQHGSVDDHPYGGGDGMVMRPEPLASAVDHIAAGGNTGSSKPLVILTSPGGRPWRQRDAVELSQERRPIVFVCGRFAGVDQRFVDAYVEREYSVGDVVLAGGELPALMMIESVFRLIPSVLGHPASAQMDSFASGYDGGLEHPLYTRPAEFRGQSVPPVLLSGDHQRIAAWRQTEAQARTRRLRPDLLRP